MVTRAFYQRLAGSADDSAANRLLNEVVLACGKSVPA
jgi:hypothetical protein